MFGMGDTVMYRNCPYSHGVPRHAFLKQSRVVWDVLDFQANGPIPMQLSLAVCGQC